MISAAATIALSLSQIYIYIKTETESITMFYHDKNENKCAFTRNAPNTHIHTILSS